MHRVFRKERADRCALCLRLDPVVPPAASPTTTRHNALTDVTLPPRGCRCCLVSLGYCF